MVTVRRRCVSVSSFLVVVAVVVVNSRDAQAQAVAQLKITEVMFDSGHPTDPVEPADHDYWWELTNLGDFSVSLAEYSWDDNSGQPGAFTFPSITLWPGESIIILNLPHSLDPLIPVESMRIQRDFRDVWNLSQEVRVLVHTDFGVPALPGLGLGGVVFLFDPSNSLIDRVDPSPPPVVGISNECLPGATCRQSVLGENGAYQAPHPLDGALGDTGSPGRISGEPTFIRGDTSADGELQLRDGFLILSQLFLHRQSTTISCQKAADVNDSGSVTLQDAIHLVTVLFLGAVEIPPPSPSCGVDPTPDALTCETFPPC